MTTIRARNTRTPRSGWSSAGSTSCRRSPSWPAIAPADVDKLEGRTEGPVPRRGPPQGDEYADAARQLPRAAMPPAEQPKEVAKEGLGEYFIYTIEGTETIRNGWSKRMRSLDAAKVPLKIQYRYRPAEYGDQLVRMYLLTNNKDSKLGTTPMPDGIVAHFSPQRRRPELPGCTVDQVCAHRRQDRAEPGRRSGSDLRAGQAQDLARQHLDAGQRREHLPPRRPAGRADRRQQLRRRMGRPHGIRPAGAELHEEGNRPGSPPHL